MDAQKRRKFRNRNKIKKNSLRNRLSVFRSNKNIYAQIIDDNTGKTLVSASSLEKEINNSKKDDKFIIEEKIGNLIAERSIEKGIKKVIFDKGSYLYHGRIKALADSARKKGLEF
tara:strand:+ start:1531 stop:1875 length:345 start_codon:yes stop_codon:yes gene_type:complete